ncbi:unnamed protein product [Brassicogethes aeneus]|uniref:Flightin n=1 Tax=Brassicogethes aeneus TaxID=1431903 RepID=A0A9P0FAT3_BRAAE|nr:unnamed protein product [Brassicogethes aeneus]
MADDDASDWFSSADEPEAPAEEAPAAAAAAPAAAAEAAPAEGGDAGGEAPAEAGEEKREEAEDEYLDPNKLILFKHWKRPTFMQYKYIYEYRQNYYNDVLHTLDRRQKGYRESIPRPQTWAERILRTRRDPINRLESFDKYLEDVKLVTRSQLSGVFHSYYFKHNFNRRYAALLY